MHTVCACYCVHVEPNYVKPKTENQLQTFLTPKNGLVSHFGVEIY